MDEFAAAFGDADTLFLLDIYPASEKPIEGITAEALAGRITKAGKHDVHYFPSFADAAGVISTTAQAGDLVNLKAGKFTLTRLIKEAADMTSISLHFSDAQIYDTDKDKREVSAFVNEISIGDVPDFASFRSVANDAGEKFVVTGIDSDGWIGKSAEFRVNLH